MTGVIKKLLLCTACILALWGLGAPIAAAEEEPPPAVRTLPDSGMMCLTFDDGSSRDDILRILTCLEKNKVRCTFFIVGKYLSAYPDLWQRAVADGDEIAYHTMNHTRLSSMSDDWIRQDVAQWNQTARDVLGEDYVIPPLARLPGGAGHQSRRILQLFADMGYTVVGWNADTYTGAIRVNPGDPVGEAVRYVRRKAAPGTILLQHFDGRDSGALERYMDYVLTRTALGTVSQALAAQQDARRLGKLSLNRMEPLRRPTDCAQALVETLERY